MKSLGFFLLVKRTLKEGWGGGEGGGARECDLKDQRSMCLIEKGIPMIRSAGERGYWFIGNSL